MFEKEISPVSTKWLIFFTVQQAIICVSKGSKGHQISAPYCTYFGHPFAVGRSYTHCTLLTAKRQKAVLLSGVVQLLIYHFSKFLIFFSGECNHVESKYVVSLSK